MSRPIVSNPSHKGFDMGDWTVRLTATVATTKNLVYAIDISAASVTALDGGGHIVDIPAVDLPDPAGDGIETVDTGIMGVAMESVGAGESCMFRFRGIVELKSAASFAKGDALQPAITGKAAAATSTGKIIGFALEQATAADQDIVCMFDGVNGFAGDPTT